MNRASIKWVQGLQFVGKADSGHAVVMDAARDMGGADSAVRPVELTLIALGGCTGIDVLNILRKMRLKIRSFEIRIRGERVEEEPKVFREIWVKYIVHGDVPEKSLKRAIDLSRSKYCSVGAMLGKCAEIHYEYEVNPDPDMPLRPPIA